MNDLFTKAELEAKPQKQDKRPLTVEEVAEQSRRQKSIHKILDMVEIDSGLAMMMNHDTFAQMQRIAAMYSQSDFVPDNFKGKPGNIMIAMNLAQRLGVDLFMLMQSMYIVHGRPGFEAKFMIALANARAPFEGPIDWVFERFPNGKIKSCTAFAVHKINGKRYTATIDSEMVTMFGWDRDKKRRDGGVEFSKWKQMDEQMYSYRSAAFLIRKVCPEVIMGMLTTDELHEIADREHETETEPEKQTKGETAAGPSGKIASSMETYEYPVCKTLGEVRVYAASIGVPDKVVDDAAASIGINRFKKTQSPENLGVLVSMMEAWQGTTETTTEASHPTAEMPQDTPAPQVKTAAPLDMPHRAMEKHEDLEPGKATQKNFPQPGYYRVPSEDLGDITPNGGKHSRVHVVDETEEPAPPPERRGKEKSVNDEEVIYLHRLFDRAGIPKDGRLPAVRGMLGIEPGGIDSLTQLTLDEYWQVVSNIQGNGETNG